MSLPASYWALVGVGVSAGLLCRKWPTLALYAALATFCNVFRAHLIPLPSDPEIAFADAVLFVLPTVALARACGVSELWSIRMIVLAPFAVNVGILYGSDARAKCLVLWVAAAQGASACVGLAEELRHVDRSLERRAATCIAIIGLLGLGFVDVWDDVAWTGVAAHAFACLAYFVHQQPQQK
jgi:hypothetical protein